MQTRQKRKLEELSTQMQNKTLDHFGLDVSTPISNAMHQGGSLDEPSRKKVKGDIARHKFFAPSLNDLPNKDLGKHIKSHIKSGETVFQQDLRVNPRKGGNYKGYMLTSTMVSSEKFDSSLKDIGEPLSPNPNSGSGEFHRSHTSPFNLGGEKTNKARTVNAPSWANITIDGFIESKAKNAVEKYGDGSVFHFRFDTAKRSTVGYMVDRGGIEGVDEDKRWKVVSTQYKRKEF
jgi:hypothetical protein